MRLEESYSLPGLLRRRQVSPTFASDSLQSLVYPNRTIYNVETPDCLFRRFTPDGKHLIGFNRTLSGLQVFQVMNASASTQQLVEAGSAAHKTEFRHFFKLAWSHTFTGFGETLHRDLCLVTPDMRFIIAVKLRRCDPSIGSEALVHGQRPSPRPNMLSCIRAMEDITLLVIDMQSGRLIDTREYPSDIIYLSGHNGISIYEDRISLLSLKHQCVRILRIGPDGVLTDLQEIGWYTGEDDSICEDLLAVRERQALAERAEEMQREVDRLAAQSFAGCIDEADLSAAAKRRKIESAQRKRDDNEQALRTLRANIDSVDSDGSSDGSQVSIANSAGDSAGENSPTVPPVSAAQQPVDPLCPDVPSTARQPRTSTMQLTTSAGNPLPFIFRFSPQAQMLRSDSSSSNTSEVRSQDTMGSIVHTLLELRNPLMTNNNSTERVSLMPLQTMQRLTPHYRMLYTRAMHHPAARLESLADSDISIIEPSLTLAPHSGLKQQLLGALFKQAWQKDNVSVQYFYRTYRQYEGLVLWRAQFVSATKLLLRFVPLQVATSRSHAPRSSAVSSSTLTNSFTLLAEYDIQTSRFDRIWDTADSCLYEQIERRLDTYRAPMSSGNRLGCSGAQAPSISNDIYLRDAFRSSQSAIRTARSGGPVQAARKASMLLPVAPQCAQESPLLDPSRFKCNLRVRQTLEKLRAASSAPIRFYDRRTGMVKFVLSPTPHLYSVAAATQSPDMGALQPVDYSVADGITMLGGQAMTAGSGVLRSGAVLLPSGGTVDLSADTGGQNSTGTPSLTPQPGFVASGNKAGVVYLFHPWLPLVLSTRSDSGTTSIPTSNIHFWQSD
ncbi:hypothetical protein H4R99_003110 [Coemansia sp. RSA 1722]|nr:hypothetical protein IWW45_005146 [Coemansia sp. RSA 485]KAJ2595263.1 hypothetical protein GGF39_003898 [Coemansia sp. RSA 1721]KAJ2601095.1 hypothetical protein H4R99_003110 [Coemansia sp. RSA 1722]